MGKSKETPQTRSRAYLTDQGYHPWTVEQNVRYPDREHSRSDVARRYLETVVRTVTDAMVDGLVPLLDPKMISFKRDCYNFADIIAVRHDAPGVTFVQTTSSSNQADRLAKIMSNSYVRTVLEAGNKIFVHGWKLRKKRGTKQTYWSVTVTEVTLNSNGQLMAGVVGEERKQEFSQPTLLPFMGIEERAG